MWAAHGDVNGVDFWHGAGRIEHDRVVAGDSQRIEGHWLDGQGRVLLRSQVSFSAVDRGGVRTVTMQIMLEPVDAPVVFGDTKEGALAVRLAPQLRLTGAVATGTLANSLGVSGAGVWGQGAQWIKVSGDVDGQHVELRFTCKASSDSKADSVRWHARPYGLIAANPFGERAFVGGAALAKETRLELREELEMELVVEMRE